LYGSLFAKDMKNRVFNAQVRRTFPNVNGTNPAVYASGANIGQPIEVLVSQPHNTGKEEILGFEVGVEKTLDFLPGFLSDFGVQLNYTYLDSEASYDKGLVASVFGSDSFGANNFLRNPPKSGQGLSKHSYNIVTFYERGAFSARLAYNWRDEYMLSPIAGPSGWALYEEARGQFDASMSYNLGKGVTVFLDATNILQEEFGRFYDNGSTVVFDEFFESMNYYGRTLAVGVRVKF
jgi:TonB-dependent receptor